MAAAAPSNTGDGPQAGGALPSPGRSLRQAVATALVLLAVIGLSYYLGPGAFFVLICVVVSVALFEVVDGLIHAGRKPSGVFAIACGLALLIVSYAEQPALYGVVLAVTVYGGFLLSLRPDRGPRPASDVAWTLLAVAWIGGGGVAATSMLLLDPGGLALLLSFILVVAADDIAAYFVGTRFGVHKMAPSISPAKSWEGFAGGLLAALAAGVAAGAIVGELSLAQGAAIGALCGLLAPVGDLVESLFKREVGIKDSGRLLPGHGGFLDRLDAIIFCAPAVFIFVRLAH